MPSLRSGHAASKILLRILFYHWPPNCGESIPDAEPDLNWFNQARPPSDSEPDQFDQSPAWQPEEVPLGDGRTLILEDS